MRCRIDQAGRLTIGAQAVRPRLALVSRWMSSAADSRTSSGNSARSCFFS